MNVETEEDAPQKIVIYWEITLLLILKRLQIKPTKLLLLKLHHSKNMIKFLMMTLSLLLEPWK